MNIEEFKPEFKKPIEHLKNEIAGLRTGRATPALVEDISVEAYGVRQPLKSVASISVQDAKTIAIEPWDKSILVNVEKAVSSSNLGINPVNDGKMIRLPLPDLTQERREELIKVLHQKLEQCRIAIRKVREECRSFVEQSEEDKEISEDEKFKLHDEIEKVVKEHNELIKNIGEEKEKEIKSV
jgi:ribosome recycling factor